MASIKDLKKRIGTVKNTQQTTRAMKMVSAAKLRRAQEAILNQRPYARRIEDLMRRLVSAVDPSSVTSPLISASEKLPDHTYSEQEGTGNDGGKSLLLLLVTSDRGLCGAFNSNVIKTAQRWMAAHKGEYSEIQLAFVGRKAHEFFKTRKVSMGPYFVELGGKVSFLKARKLADQLTELFLSGKFHEVKVIYNEFKNAVSQQVLVEDFLPLKGESLEKEGVSGEADASLDIVKPSVAAVLDQLLKKYFAIQAFRILLESQASEHGARMSAMENATKNAGEMIRHLTLQYNKQRQAGITKELLEIIAGSESQKVS